MAVFDLSACAPLQRTIIEAALQRCSFDFQRLLPELRAKTGRSQLPVSFADLSRMARDVSDTVPVVPVVEPAAPRAHGGEDHGDHRRATLGLFYYDGRIVVHAGLVTQPEVAAEVFLSECAHAVDRFFLTPEMRRAIWEVWHPDPVQNSHHDTVHGWAVPFAEWQGEMDRPGTQEVGYFESGLEAWMSAFVHAFAPDVPVTLDEPFAHRTNAEQATRIREIVQPGTQPEGVPVCAARFGYAYHQMHAHWWVICPRTFPNRRAAEAEGLRACRLCEP